MRLSQSYQCSHFTDEIRGIMISRLGLHPLLVMVRYARPKWIKISLYRGVEPLSTGPIAEKVLPRFDTEKNVVARLTNNIIMSGNSL